MARRTTRLLVGPHATARLAAARAWLAKRAADDEVLVLGAGWEAAEINTMVRRLQL